MEKCSHQAAQIAARFFELPELLMLVVSGVIPEVAVGEFHWWQLTVMHMALQPISGKSFRISQPINAYETETKSNIVESEIKIAGDYFLAESLTPWLKQGGWAEAAAKFVHRRSAFYRSFVPYGRATPLPSSAFPLITSISVKSTDKASTTINIFTNGTMDMAVFKRGGYQRYPEHLQLLRDLSIVDDKVPKEQHFDKIERGFVKASLVCNAHLQLHRNTLIDFEDTLGSLKPNNQRELHAYILVFLLLLGRIPSFIKSLAQRELTETVIYICASLVHMAQGFSFLNRMPVLATLRRLLPLLGSYCSNVHVTNFALAVEIVKEILEAWSETEEQKKATVIAIQTAEKWKEENEQFWHKNLDLWKLQWNEEKLNEIYYDELEESEKNKIENNQQTWLERICTATPTALKENNGRIWHSFNPAERSLQSLALLCARESLLLIGTTFQRRILPVTSPALPPCSLVLRVIANERSQMPEVSSAIATGGWGSTYAEPAGNFDEPPTSNLPPESSSLHMKRRSETLQWLNEACDRYAGQSGFLWYLEEVGREMTLTIIQGLSPAETKYAATNGGWIRAAE